MVHTMIKKSYPHKMLLNMPFAYNSTLCYLGCICAGYGLCLLVNRTRCWLGELKEKKAAEHNAGGELRKSRLSKILDGRVDLIPPKLEKALVILLKKAG